MESENLSTNNVKGLKAMLKGKSRDIKVTKRRFEYTIQEKMTILKEYQLGVGVEPRGWKTKISLKYKIDPSQLDKWLVTRNNLSKLDYLEDDGQLWQNLKSMDVSRKSMKPGKAVRYPYIEAWLYNKFEEYRERHMPVSTRLLVVVSMARYPLIFMEGDSSNRYKRVFDWVYRFRERYGISLRT